MKNWSLLWIIFLVACSNEYPIEPEHPKPPVADEQEVSIKITFPGSEQAKTKSPSTYAVTAEEENTVKRLDIFAFEGGNNDDLSDDIFLYRVTVTEDKIKDSGTTQDGTTKEVVTSLRRLSQEQRFIFVANLPPLNLTLEEGVTTQQEIVDQLLFDGNPWHSAQESNAYTPIPMWGQIKKSTLINSSTSLNLETVYLIRSMAKIEVSYAEGIPGFKVKNIYVCNSSASGYIAPNKDQWGEKVITKTNPTTTPRVGNPLGYAFASTSGNLMERTIYVPESDSLIINGTDSIKPAFLVIEADYKGAANFYRIDFAKDRVYHPLLRNHRYQIHIMGAKEGYKSLKEAMEAPMSDFNFSLTLDENQNINEVIYLGDQYMLGIEVSELLFDWDMIRIGKPFATDAKAHYPLHVYTTYPGGWTASLLNASTWVNLEGKTSGVTNKVDSITINIGAENRTGVERNDTLIIQAGMLIKKVAIRQSGGANSRMIFFEPGSNKATTRIPLAFADAANVARGGKSFSGIATDPSAFDARIIWQEAGAGQSTVTVAIEGSGDIKDRTLVVTAQAGMKRSGNAIVAIISKGSDLPFVGGKDTDEVLWSWHIWCMESDDYMNKDYHNPNVPLFMKRALGRYDGNQGMFYQWGRKDPFPKALTDVVPMNGGNLPVKEATNLPNTIMNPATFYYIVPPTYPYWTGSSAPASDLWKATQATKTYNDPCPVGWRVPEKEKSIYWTAEATTGFSKGHLPEGTGVWQSDSNDSFWTLTAGTIFESSGSGIGTGSSNSSAGRPVRCVKDIQLIKTSL
jgi:hypothetical protein